MDVNFIYHNATGSSADVIFSAFDQHSNEFRKVGVQCRDRTKGCVQAVTVCTSIMETIFVPDAQQQKITKNSDGSGSVTVECMKKEAWHLDYLLYCVPQCQTAGDLVVGVPDPTGFANESQFELDIRKKNLTLARNCIEKTCFVVSGEGLISHSWLDYVRTTHNKDDSSTVELQSSMQNSVEDVYDKAASWSPGELIDNMIKDIVKPEEVP